MVYLNGGIRGKFEIGVFYKGMVGIVFLEGGEVEEV